MCVCVCGSSSRCVCESVCCRASVQLPADTYYLTSVQNKVNEGCYYTCSDVAQTELPPKVWPLREGDIRLYKLLMCVCVYVGGVTECTGKNNICLITVHRLPCLCVCNSLCGSFMEVHGNTCYNSTDNIPNWLTLYQTVHISPSNC